MIDDQRVQLRISHAEETLEVSAYILLIVMVFDGST